MQNHFMNTLQTTINYGDTLWVLAKRYNTTIEAIVLANPGINLDQIYVGQAIQIPINNAWLESMGLYAAKINNEILDLSNTLRGLEIESSVYRRLICDHIDKQSPHIPLYVSRLQKSLNDQELLFGRYFGEEHARVLRGFLEQPYKLCFDYVKASKANIDPTHIESLWEKACDESSHQLATMNPKWEEAKWQRILYEQMNLWKQEVKVMRKQDHRTRILLIDKQSTHSYKIADEFTNGIIKSFPQYFHKEKSE